MLFSEVEVHLFYTHPKMPAHHPGKPYDDLLGVMAACVGLSPYSGSQVCCALCSEHQHTNPLQWDINLQQFFKGYQPLVRLKVMRSSVYESGVICSGVYIPQRRVFKLLECG